MKIQRTPYTKFQKPPLTTANPKITQKQNNRLTPKKLKNDTNHISSELAQTPQSVESEKKPFTNTSDLVLRLRIVDKPHSTKSKYFLYSKRSS